MYIHCTYRYVVLIYIRSLWTQGLILILWLLLERFIDQSRWCYSDALTGRLETILIGAIFHHTHFACLIDITIFTLNLTCSQFCFDFKRTISALIAICIGTIFVVSVSVNGEV